MHGIWLEFYTHPDMFTRTWGSAFKKKRCSIYSVMLGSCFWLFWVENENYNSTIKIWFFGVLERSEGEEEYVTRCYWERIAAWFMNHAKNKNCVRFSSINLCIGRKRKREIWSWTVSGLKLWVIFHKIGNTAMIFVKKDWKKDRKNDKFWERKKEEKMLRFYCGSKHEKRFLERGEKKRGKKKIITYIGKLKVVVKNWSFSSLKIDKRNKGGKKYENLFRRKEMTRKRRNVFRSKIDACFFSMGVF